MYNPEKCIDFSFGIKKNEIACSCQKPFVKSSSFLEWGLPETSFNCILDLFFEKQNNQSAYFEDRVQAFPFLIFNLINQGQVPKQAGKARHTLTSRMVWSLHGAWLGDSITVSCPLVPVTIDSPHRTPWPIPVLLWDQMEQLENEGQTVQLAQPSRPLVVPQETSNSWTYSRKVCTLYFADRGQIKSYNMKDDG